MYQIFVQVLGFIAMGACIISVQFNTHFKIMAFKGLSSFLFGLQYILLGSYTAVVMELVGVIRNFVFAYNVKKNKSNTLWIVLFSVITVASGVITLYLSWDKTLSVLSKYTTDENGLKALGITFSGVAIFAKLISTIGYGFKNPHLIRMLNLPSYSLWILHDVVFLSIASVINNALSIVSIIIAEIRFRKPKLLPIDILDNDNNYNEKNNDEVNDVSVKTEKNNLAE